MGDSQPRRLEERFAREVGRIAGLAALALVQVTILTTPLGFAIPLVLILVICRALIGVAAAFPDTGVGHSLRWALYGGLALDIISGTPLGAHALALLLPTLVVIAVTSRLRVDRPLILLLAMVVSTVIYEVVIALLTAHGSIDWPVYIQMIVLPSVLLALIPTLPTFVLLRRLLRGELRLEV